MDQVEYELRRQELGCVRFDGDLSPHERQQAVDSFINDTEIKVFLSSLQAGCQGLNLTVANHVILVDPWYNPALELQARDRVHRIGQTKPVYIVRMKTKDTVEEDICKKQYEKFQTAQHILGYEESIIVQDIDVTERDEEIMDQPTNHAGICHGDIHLFFKKEKKVCTVATAPCVFKSAIEKSEGTQELDFASWLLKNKQRSVQAQNAKKRRRTVTPPLTKTDKKVKKRLREFISDRIDPTSDSDNEEDCETKVHKKLPKKRKSMKVIAMQIISDEDEE
jgi:superfamily II DNA/RNA helicase